MSIYCKVVDFVQPPLPSKKSESSLSGRLYTGYKVAKCNKCQCNKFKFCVLAQFFLDIISQPIFPKILVSFQFCACDSQFQ